jgi:hypothetical protein
MKPGKCIERSFSSTNAVISVAVMLGCVKAPFS